MCSVCMLATDGYIQCDCILVTDVLQVYFMLTPFEGLTISSDTEPVVGCVLAVSTGASFVTLEFSAGAVLTCRRPCLR